MNCGEWIPDGDYDNRTLDAGVYDPSPDGPPDLLPDPDADEEGRAARLAAKRRAKARKGEHHGR